VPGLPIVGQGFVDPCANFSGSGAVVFWDLGVRCGRVKVVSLSLCSVWGSQPNYGSLPTRGRVPGLPVDGQGWGDPCANFSGPDAVVLGSYGVRCGRVKVVSSSPGYVWGVSA